MDQPLGTAVGNTLEVAEVLDLLEGRTEQADLVELCATLGAVLLELTEQVSSHAEGIGLMHETLASGAVLERFREWIAAQGGDLEAFRRTLARLEGHRKIEVRSPRPGWIEAMDVSAMGELLRSLGAGRHVETDRISPLVGMLVHAKLGAKVDYGGLLATVYAKPDEITSNEQIAERLLACYHFSREAVARRPLIYQTVGLDDYLQIAWPDNVPRSPSRLT
jgi:thymidine phosphorylase